MKSVAYLIVALSSFLSFTAIADENIELMPKGMWKDSATGLIWDRCVAGQTWNGTMCIGEGTRVLWDDAKRIAASVTTGGFHDWRLPTLAELYTIRKCSNGVSTDEKAIVNIEPNQGGPFTVVRWCQLGSQSPTIDATVFPNTPAKDFWTGSPPKDPEHSNAPYYHLTVRFFTPNDYFSTINYVRVVRSSSMIDSAGLASVLAEQVAGVLAKRDAKEKARLDAERKAAEERRIANEEYEKRQQAEVRSYNSILSSKDPQAMYLAAGKYERNGDAYKANQIYERLIDRFPSSPFAVKASDQLSQNRRVVSVNSATDRANSEAGQRAYNACRVEVDSCYSRGGNNCWRNCDSLR